MTKLTTRQRDRLIEAAQNAIEFSVIGISDFPIDMLRYDLCWPASESDSRNIDHSSAIIQRQRNHELRIDLKGLKPPTVARWHSFGWTVVI
jgi:hypothetical protein